MSTAAPSPPPSRLPIASTAIPFPPLGATSLRSRLRVWGLDFPRLRILDPLPRDGRTAGGACLSVPAADAAEQIAAGARLSSSIPGGPALAHRPFLGLAADRPLRPATIRTSSTVSSCRPIARRTPAWRPDAAGRRPAGGIVTLADQWRASIEDVPAKSRPSSRARISTNLGRALSRRRSRQPRARSLRREGPDRSVNDIRHALAREFPTIPAWCAPVAIIPGE